MLKPSVKTVDNLVNHETQKSKSNVNKGKPKKKKKTKEAYRSFVDVHVIKCSRVRSTTSFRLVSTRA